MDSLAQNGLTNRLPVPTYDSPPLDDSTDMKFSNGDYDTSYPVEVRKYLRTYGLTPPNVEPAHLQTQRCMIRPVNVVEC